MANRRNTVFMKDMAQYRKYQIGRYTYGAPKVEDYRDGATLKIGSFCSINRKNVSIFLGGNHRTDWVTTSPLNYFFKMEMRKRGRQKRKYISSTTNGDVIIGNDVWIGTGVTIMSGVTIGDGAVIGARTVVAKDVEPYGVCVGNPGRVVKKRFSDDIVEKLLRIRWWDWDDEKIKENFYMLLSDDIQAFVDKHDPRDV